MPAPTAPRGDEHDFLAGLAQRGDLRDELFQLRRVGLLAAVGEHAGAEFHDEADGGFERVTMHAGKVRKKSACGKRKNGSISLRAFQVRP